MSELTGLHAIFRKISIFGTSIGFRAITFAMSGDVVVIVGNLMSQLYMDEVLRPVVCIYCARTSASTKPGMTTPEHISPESAKFLSSEQCCAY